MVGLRIPGAVQVAPAEWMLLLECGSMSSSAVRIVEVTLVLESKLSLMAVVRSVRAMLLLVKSSSMKHMASMARKYVLGAAILLEILGFDCECTEYC